MRDSTISPRDIAWAMLRAAVGVLIITHGYGKIFGVSPEGVDRMVGFTGTVIEMGLPAPEAFAWLAALSELVGGALLVIGLFTRPAALFALATMIGAVYSLRAESFSAMEKPLLFGFVFIAFLIGGAGRLSFDAVRRAKKERLALSIFR